MAFAIVLGFACILAGYKAIGKGLVLGTFFSIVNFVLIGVALPLRVAASGRKGFLLSLTSILGRYALLAVPLVVAVRSEAFDLWGAVVGIFMIQLVILLDHLPFSFSSITAKRVTGR